MVTIAILAGVFNEEVEAIVASVRAGYQTTFYESPAKRW
jgi:hypothetical protein